MNATRAAVEEGIVAGGGAALLYASRVLAKLEVANDDQRHGVDIVRRRSRHRHARSPRTPASTVPSWPASCSSRRTTSYGFDAQSETYKDLVKAGIIDPTKVVRIALQDAASVAGLLVTTEAMVAEKPKKTVCRFRRHAGQHGRHGLLIAVPSNDVTGAASQSGPRPFILVRSPSATDRSCAAAGLDALLAADLQGNAHVQDRSRAHRSCRGIQGQTLRPARRRAAEGAQRHAVGAPGGQARAGQHRTRTRNGAWRNCRASAASR